MGRKSTDERKKEVVEATLELIGEKGIESLRTSEISDRVGFSEAALYKHFSSKEEVIRTTIRKAGEELIDSLTDVVEEAGTENEVEKLRLVLKKHFKFISHNPGITRLLFSDEVHFNREDLRQELLGIIDRYRDFIESILRRGIENGQIKRDLDMKAATTLYLGLVQSQILFWSLSGGEKSLDNQVDVLWPRFREILGVEG